MSYPALFSILFFSVCIVSMVSGVLVLLNNPKAPGNRCFFAMIIAINFWSVGLAFANIAPGRCRCYFLLGYALNHNAYRFLQRNSRVYPEIENQGKILVEKAMQMAYHNSLTGLHNREWFIDYLNKAIHAAQKDTPDRRDPY